MKNHGQYRVVLRVETTGHKIVICRRATEDEARVTANKIAEGIPSGVTAEVFIGIGRSTSMVYAVGSPEDNV